MSWKFWRWIPFVPWQWGAEPFEEWCARTGQGKKSHYDENGDFMFYDAFFDGWFRIPVYYKPNGASATELRSPPQSGGSHER
jgi:hypothetical protein